MPEFKLAEHAREMVKERQVHEEWVWRTPNEPDSMETRDDGNNHYFKSIKEREGRGFTSL